MRTGRTGGSDDAAEAAEAVGTGDAQHHIGLPGDDVGRSGITSIAKEKGAFRTPTLRNITLTAPYMHDGSKKTLADVVKFYEDVKPKSGREPRIAELLEPIKLTDAERKQLIEFLSTLTGDRRDPNLRLIPELP